MNTTLPFSLSIKPVGAKCNLNCSYCYYLANLSDDTQPMSDEVLETMIKNHIDSQPKNSPQVDFIWHGGEPLLIGRDFYEKAFALQSRWSSGKKVVNTFQTNGTLINKQWAKFFREHNVMVGISIDGPNLINDIGRIDRDGNSSFERTMRGFKHLNEHSVEFNTLTVINNRTYKHGAKIYQFLKESGSRYMQFQPCLDHELDRLSKYDWSLTGEQWGVFLCDTFDAWGKDDIGDVFVQFFENSLMVLMGHPSQMCHHAPSCGQQLMMEANGEVFSCDHYSYDSHSLGNVKQSALQALVQSETQVQFGQAKNKQLSLQCQQCDFLPLCQGGCPKYRLNSNADNQKVSTLCNGYQLFYRHALPKMLKMVDAMNSGYSPKYHALF